MSPEGSIHFCPPCRLKISEWPSRLFPAWSWNKKSENLLTGNTQGHFFCLSTSFYGARNKNSWDQGKTLHLPFRKECLCGHSQMAKSDSESLGMHLGCQNEKHTMKRLLKLFFMLAVDLVGLILECFPPSASCESHTPGEGVGCHAQVALRYVFFFLSGFHTSAALLQKRKNSPDMLVTGKFKRRCWEAAVQEHWDKPPPSPNRALVDRLHRNSFCPCSGLNSSLKKHGLHPPDAAKAPASTSGICFPSGELLPSVCFP